MNEHLLPGDASPDGAEAGPRATSDDTGSPRNPDQPTRGKAAGRADKRSSGRAAAPSGFGAGLEDEDSLAALSPAEAEIAVQPAEDAPAWPEDSATTAAPAGDPVVRKKRARRRRTKAAVEPEVQAEATQGTPAVDGEPSELPHAEAAPDDEVAPPAGDPLAAAAVAEGDAPPAARRRKKRRRRGRRDAAERAEGQGEAAADVGDASDDDGGATEAEELSDDAVSDAPAAQGGTPEEQAAEERKRRRRGSRGGRRRRAQKDGERTEPAAAAESIPGEEGDDLPRRSEPRGRSEAPSAEPSAPAEGSRSGKKRRRRRKRRSGAQPEGEQPRERADADADADDHGHDDDAEFHEDGTPVEAGERAEDTRDGDGGRSSKRGRRGKKKAAAPPEKSAEQLAAEAEALRTQTILVNAVEPEEKRVAVIEGERIVDLLMTAESQKTLVNDVYRGKVVNLEPAIGAAFIDFGQGRNGFLHTSDVLPIYGEDSFQLVDLLTARVDFEEWGEDDRVDPRDLRDDDDSRGGAAAQHGDEGELDADHVHDDEHEHGEEADGARGADGDHAEDHHSDDHADDAPSASAEEDADDGSDAEDDAAADSPSSLPSSRRHGRRGRHGQDRHDERKGQRGRDGQHKARSAERRKGRDRRPISDLLRVGDSVVVQITKDAIGDKGPTLTTYISIPGRYLVLMPSMGRTGVSRKIPDEKERRRLKKILASLDVPNDMGVIVRTAGVGKKREDLARDLDYLLGVWEGFGRKLRASRGPTPLYQESDVATRTLRDLFSAQTKRVLVDDYSVHEQMCEFASKLLPEHVHRIELYDGERPIFHQHGVEQDFEKVFARRVDLPSGGSIVFDQAEALVAIDVNSGRTRTDSFDFEKIALKTNLEAVKEIARQIRLRDLGGIIVCDFIDMVKSSSNRQVERALRDALESDRARSKLGRISQFGLLEMTRQRLGPGTHKKVFQACPRCRGTGRVRTLESRAQAILRRLGSALTQKGFATVEVKAHPEVVKYLKEDLYDYVRAMEHRTEREIRLVGSPDQTEDSVLNYLRADGREVRPGGRRKR